MNPKKLLIAAAIWLFALPALAENYPYRSDILWVTVPDHADWIYRTGESASIEVQLYEYGMPVDGISVDYELGGDLLPADARGSVKLKNGRATIPIGTMKKPGFRDCRLTATIGGAVSRHHIKVGFSPEKIEPYTRMPKDFEEFWTKNKEQLNSVPLSYTKRRAEQYCTDKVDCYLIKLQVTERGQAVYGYLSCPKNARPGSCPVVFCPPGAGVKTIKEPQRGVRFAEEGFIRLEIEIHGLNPELNEETFREIRSAFEGRENGYLTNGLDHRDNYYMKRVYMACIRSIDLLTSLPEWDGRNVIVQGGSQGGALALIAAALDRRVTACVANHPALSDMARFEAGEADGYPHFSRTRGMNTADKVQTMAYYDVVNFARLIRIPVYMTWGFNDDTCPPTTSYAVYNTLQCPKEALITPINEHWTSATTGSRQMAWIKSHLKE